MRSGTISSPWSSRSCASAANGWGWSSSTWTCAGACGQRLNDELDASGIAFPERSVPEDNVGQTREEVKLDFNSLCQRLSERLGNHWLRTLRPPPVRLGMGQLAVLLGHEQGVSSVAFSPDGSHMLSGSHDKTLRLWDAGSGECLAVLRGHEDWVSSVAFSPSGNLLLSGSGDKTLRLWDASSGECLAVLCGHEDYVWNVGFSPDGSRVLSGSSDGTTRMWDARSSECLEILPGNGLLPARASTFRWKKLLLEGEQVIAPAASGPPAARFPDPLHPSATHPDGDLWAGANYCNYHFVLLKLEGEG